MVSDLFAKICPTLSDFFPRNSPMQSEKWLSNSFICGYAKFLNGLCPILQRPSAYYFFLKPSGTARSALELLERAKRNWNCAKRLDRPVA